MGQSFRKSIRTCMMPLIQTMRVPFNVVKWKNFVSISWKVLKRMVKSILILQWTMMKPSKSLKKMNQVRSHSMNLANFCRCCSRIRSEFFKKDLKDKSMKDLWRLQALWLEDFLVKRLTQLQVTNNERNQGRRVTNKMHQGWPSRKLDETRVS